MRHCVVMDELAENFVGKCCISVQHLFSQHFQKPYHLGSPKLGFLGTSCSNNGAKISRVYHCLTIHGSWLLYIHLYYLQTSMNVTGRFVPSFVTTQMVPLAVAALMGTGLEWIQSHVKVS